MLNYLDKKYTIFITIYLQLRYKERGFLTRYDKNSILEHLVAHNKNMPDYLGLIMKILATFYMAIIHIFFNGWI